MKPNSYSQIATNFRTLHGKLFAAFFNQFGAAYVHEIEDAIQNAFYKALKSWKPNTLPENQENWLYIVARNDLLNQIKKGHLRPLQEEKNPTDDLALPTEDLRLKTIIFLGKIKNVSSEVKVLFILKNIFGLHVKEIAAATLLSTEAIYKRLNRTKKDFFCAENHDDFASSVPPISLNEIELVEEILYAVFNIGFDSFDHKIESIINEDLCLEALALAKILYTTYQKNSSKNLLSLFCFHLSRIPARIKDGKMISFFEQDQSKWSPEFLQLGFHYLDPPKTLNKYYLEAVIVSKHMTTTKVDKNHWQDIVKLYQFLLSIEPSPIVKLNLCYGLYMAKRGEEAMALLASVEEELPNKHFYLTLIKTKILNRGHKQNSTQTLSRLLNNLSQKIRRDHILDNISSKD